MLYYSNINIINPNKNLAYRRYKNMISKQIYLVSSLKAFRIPFDSLYSLCPTRRYYPWETSFRDFWSPLERNCLWEYPFGWFIISFVETEVVGDYDFGAVRLLLRFRLWLWLRRRLRTRFALNTLQNYILLTHAQAGKHRHAMDVPLANHSCDHKNST